MVRASEPAPGHKAYGEPDETRPVLQGLGKASIADCIDTVGFGLYQVHVFILSAGFIVAEGSELQMASGLSNAIIEEFHITTHVGRSMLMTCTFLGFAAGTIASGPLGDVYGRRVPMLCGYIGVVCTAVATFFAPSAGWIYVLRFILGCFGGVGIPTALITISEVSPGVLRGMSTAALGVAYCLGDLWAALGLLLILPDLASGPWRMLLFWAAVPATSLICFGMLSPISRYDTPFFLAANGRHGEAKAALKLIAEMNGRPDLADMYQAPEEDSRVVGAPVAKAGDFWRGVRTMFEWPTVLYVFALSLMFFVKDFGYYGMGVFWPLAWVELDFGDLSAAADLLLTAVLGIPGVGVAMIMMYWVRRKPALAISGCCCAVGAMFIYWLEQGDARGLLGVLLFKLWFPTLQMVTMLLPCEIFPTQIRAFAYGTVALFGRIATIISPTVVEHSHGFFLCFCAALTLATVVFATVLPETKDCKIDDTPASPAKKKDSAYGAA